MPAPSLKIWMSIPSPIAPKTYLAPVAPAWPAVTIAAQALLSGNGRAASTASVRRSRVMKSTPRMPPMSRIRLVCQ